ncbi:MAG: metal ABC transporter permease, partial [Chloroflexi bacterium]
MDTLLAWLIDPLGYPFMVRGLLASVMVGVVCSVLGTYIVLRGMAFFGDALAHAILPGVVIAYLLGWPLSLGALIVGILTALGIGTLSTKGQIKEDTAIGVIFAGAFALGVALLSTVRSYSTDLAHFLFGNVLGVSNSDLWLTAGLGGLVLLTVIGFYKEFLVLSFDPILAETLRLPATFLRYLLLVLIAVTIVVSLQTVGVALMVAMLVTPAASASLLARRLPPMMVVSAL